MLIAVAVLIDCAVPISVAALAACIVPITMVVPAACAACAVLSAALECNIRIYHECEGRIEKSGPRIAVWHHEACRVMTNSDPEGQILRSHRHTNNGFFFLLAAVFLFKNKLPEVPEYIYNLRYNFT